MEEEREHIFHIDVNVRPRLGIWQGDETLQVGRYDEQHVTLRLIFISLRDDIGEQRDLQRWNSGHGTLRVQGDGGDDGMNLLQEMLLQVAALRCV